MSGHVLPPLPYDYAALQPWIDEQTMRIHHDCHHRACVDALNAIEVRLASVRPAPVRCFPSRVAASRDVTGAQGDTVIVIRYLEQLTAAYAAEHFLHCLFWDSMGPSQHVQPEGELADQIAQDFGSFTAFKSEFCEAAISLETGGWVILGWQPVRERLGIFAAESQRLQADWLGCALLALDMYEHAYYLKYQNRRAEYAHNWWNTVDWSGIGRRFTARARAGLALASHAAGHRLNGKKRHRHAVTTVTDGVPDGVPVAGDSGRSR